MSSDQSPSTQGPSLEGQAADSTMQEDKTAAAEERKPGHGGKILVFTAPSGAGKTTLVRHLLKTFPDRLAFSVSATTRAARPGEQHGKDYYFLDAESFATKVREGAFLEYEEVYSNQFYGTLRSEIDRLWAEGYTVLFDVEVKGATAIKMIFGDAARVVFVAPPSEEILFARLRNRGTESPESLQKRMRRAAEELNYRDRFDLVLINDELDRACKEAETITLNWLSE